ncbi:hypothetical protein [Clostridium chromiireducens]|uniref:Putative endo-beta-N-acetylglucosaminidase n=1 Tax=Clostridium chromiireducens TaxID=225345 RepID=A0A1V4IDU6_9CLOT|nr:hypothetical protein [Clostridium chromiireducens]OPJ58123.1 putative endo-beta-N-acetylglucosaminidase precursor [Clostridium chromiireducens]
MKRKLSVILLALFIVIQLLPLQVNASTVSKELKVSSELTQWVLDEPTNTLYAISETGKSLIFINAATMSIEKDVTLNGRPTDIIKDNGKLYIALDNINQIVIVDMASRAITETIHTSSSPYRIAKDGDKIYYTELSGIGDIYEYNLTTNTAQAIPVDSSSASDLEINTKDHILYIGETSSGSDMTYYSTVYNKVIGKTNYDGGYGFPYPARCIIFDGSNVYYAGRDFKPDDPTKFNGDFGNTENLIYANKGLVYTNKSIYNKDTHIKLGDYGLNIDLVQASDNTLYIYSKDNGIIKRFSNSYNIINSSNVISLISGKPADPIPNTKQSTQINSSISTLQMKSKLIKWVLNEPMNTLYGISKEDKALFFINAETLNLEKSLTFTCSPTDIIEDGGNLYITLNDINEIVIVDMAKRAITGRLHTSSDPYRIEKDGDKIYYVECRSWFSVYEYNLTTNTDKKISVGNIHKPEDLEINKKDHILYIGEAGSSGSHIVYYSTSDNKVISKTNYNEGGGFYGAVGNVVFDGSNVYYAGRDFKLDDPTRFNGDFGNTENVIYANKGLVYTNKSIYNKDTHVKLGDYGLNVDLVQASDTTLYTYSKDNGIIKRFNNNYNMINSSNVISLISGKPADIIPTTKKSTQINSGKSVLQIKSKLTQWVLNEQTNTLYGISKDDKALFFINTQTLNLEKSLTFTCGPTDIIEDGGNLYIALDDANQIAIVDMTKREITKILHTSSDPFRIVKDGNYIFYTERDQWCDIYAYNLITNIDEEIFQNDFFEPDLAINTKDHILYIGESGLGVSNMTYVSIAGQGVISKTNYDPALGFQYPERSIIFDGETVYYAGSGFNKQDAARVLGNYDKKNIIFARYGSAYTKTNIYDSKSYSLIENTGSNRNLIEISDNLAMYYYSEADNSIYANWTYATSIPTNGWSYFQRKWYFFNNKTMVVNDWRQDSSKRWFYLGTDGAMVSNVWRQDSSKHWFYLDSDGAMITNSWKKDLSKRWFYLGSDGAMASNTWKLYNGKWYYLKANGEMATGWIFNDGAWYYLYPSGEMALNTTIDGYRLNGNGAWIR